jgi:hypothetical protein
MPSLSASELLRVWERGLSQPSVERALALLSATNPEASTEALAQLSIGARDAQLLRLRERIFGSQLTSLAVCPQCEERVELDFTVEEIAVGAKSSSEQTRFELSVGTYEVQFRLPNSLDLLAIETFGASPKLVESFLLKRCLLSVREGVEERLFDDLPAEVVGAVVEEMARADPQADVQLALCCPQCKHSWQLTFDIVSYFWGELHAWAQRVLREVHQLASAYGWREEEILALSAWRRQVYLGMIGG